MLRYLTHIRDRYKDPFRNRPNWAEKTILLLTIGIALIYRGQLKEMHGAGEQTADLVKYAKAQADASDRNAGAAEKAAKAAADSATAAGAFATSAEGINAQTKIAVDKFDRMAKASENSIRAIQTTAQNALQASLDISRKDQRAWLSLQAPITTDGSEERNGDVIHLKSVTVVIANTGKTPGRNGSIESLFTGPLDWDAEIPDYDERVARFGPGIPITHGLIVAPSSAWVLNLLPPMKIGIGRRTSKGIGYLYLVGRITYEDVFGATHHTKYCFVNSEGLEFVPCMAGNWMD
jgi:hypothetical protein